MEPDLIYIAHRGNLDGPNKSRENSPDYIIEAANAGFDVEIDVWNCSGRFYLGHDEPQHEVDKEFLYNPAFWCHAKNISALATLKNLGAHCFWHQEDDVTLTSRGIIWTYPNKELTLLSVCVMPELNDQDFSKCYGVCSDFIRRVRDHA